MLADRRISAYRPEGTNDDGLSVIDGGHQLESLNGATLYLGVTNVSGFTFWGLETPDGIVPLNELEPRLKGETKV